MPRLDYSDDNDPAFTVVALTGLLLALMEIYGIELLVPFFMVLLSPSRNERVVIFHIALHNRVIGNFGSWRIRAHISSSSTEC